MPREDDLHLRALKALEGVAGVVDDVPLAARAGDGEQVVMKDEYAELEYAKVLDWHGIPWQYEPTTFVLARDDEGRVTEAFTPDFYLPDQDLYLEVTVMKQSLVTRKNRKLRKIRELYPEVKVKLFYERDFERLATRYGLRKAS